MYFVVLSVGGLLVHLYALEQMSGTVLTYSYRCPYTNVDVASVL